MSNEKNTDNLTNDDKEFIINLSKEMSSQDNRGTAPPFGLTIMQDYERLLPEGYDGQISCYWLDHEATFYNIEELKSFITENHEEDDLPKAEKEILEMESLYDLRDTSTANELSMTIVDTKTELEIREHGFNFFLTEKAYKEHLRCNRHNLSNPKSYGVHLYRNEEMETLYKIIHKLAKELSVNKNKQNKD